MSTAELMEKAYQEDQYTLYAKIIAAHKQRIRHRDRILEAIDREVEAKRLPIVIPQYSDDRVKRSVWSRVWAEIINFMKP